MDPPAIAYGRWHMIFPLESVDLSTSFDICIVGAGAAGITIACELDGSGRRVILLDPGRPGRFERVRQDPYDGSASLGHPPPMHFRRRGFGGTTTIWGGRCVPLDAIDFEIREHVPNSGWPIEYAELSQYYPGAMEYCDAGQCDFDICTALRSARPTLPGYHGDDVIDAGRIERYSLPTDFGRRYGARLVGSRNVSVVTGAHVLRLHRNPAHGRISQVEVALPSGKTRRVVAGTVVVAAGGLETARLLLASDLEGGGLGNASDCLGRYYMCHMEIVLGILWTQPGAIFQFERTTDGAYARRKFQITPAAQRKHRLLNAAFRLHYPNIADPAHASPVLSATVLAKRMLIPEYRRILEHGSERALTPGVAVAHLRNVVRQPGVLAGFAFDWTRRRILSRRKLPHMLATSADGGFSLDLNAEQVPCFDSRVELGKERDAFSIPRLHVNWKASALDHAGLARIYRMLHERLNTHTTCFDINLDRLDAAVSRAGPVGGHHIGTARMSASPRDGVVDRECAVFGVPNLFVAGAAVFPTSGHANPTLTIVALALRLANHLLAKQTGR